MKLKILYGIAPLATLCLGLFAGMAYEISHQKSISESTQRFEALTKARQLQTALIVLSLLNREKPGDIKAYLETQIKSDLVVLLAMRPVLDLSLEDMSKINESIDGSESYLKGKTVTDVSRNQLFGHWRYSEAGQACDTFYRDDGTFTGSIALQGKIVWEYAGSWSLSDNFLNYEYTQSSAQRIPVGTTGTDKIIEIADDHVVLKSKDGSEYTYRHVK